MDSEKNNLKKVQSQINKQYKSAQKMYDTQLKELQQLQPQYEQSITAGYESQIPILQQTATKSLEDIGMQKEQTKQSRESALTTARRQYEQGLQRSQQVFGGVAPSMAGQASADILAGEQLRQTGQATTQAAQNLIQLGGAEREVQANLANALQQIEVKKQQDLMRLRDTFRQEINAINAQKGSLAMNKANAQLQALQDYNARKRQLEDYATQQRDAIANYEKQLQLQLRYTPAQKQTYVSPLAQYGFDDTARKAIVSQFEKDPTLMVQLGASPIYQGSGDNKTLIGYKDNTTGEQFDLQGRNITNYSNR